MGVYGAFYGDGGGVFMKKRDVIFLVLALAAAGGVFAQSESRFSIGGGITGGWVLPGFQIMAEIDVGKTGGNVVEIEAGTVDILSLQAFASIRNYVFGQDLAYISYGVTTGLSSMLFGATFGGGIRMPLTEDKKLCLDTNGKLAVGLLGYPRAFASVSLLYRF
jgi:hypothetical protein